MPSVNLLEWLKSRFYEKTEVDTKVNTKADKTYVDNNFVTDSELSLVLDEELATKADTVHIHQITDVENLNTKLSELQADIDSLVGLTFTIVESFEALPEIGVNGTIYLVPIPEDETENDNKYTEYFWNTASETYEEWGTVGINYTIDAALDQDSENPVQNKVIKAALDNKADNTSITSIESEITSLEGELNTKVDKSGLSDRFSLSIDESGNLILSVSES